MNTTDFSISTGEYITLKCTDFKGQGLTAEAIIAVDKGSNLLRFTVDGKNIIDYDKTLLDSNDFTGTPVLFPTPNRIKDATYTFEGKEYIQSIDGQKIVLHGLVLFESWQVEESVCTADAAVLKTRIAIKKGSKLFEAYPFECTLTLTFSLTREGIVIDYAVKNDGAGNLPFGFALHPYFTKLNGGAEKIKVPANRCFLTDENMIPTEETAAVSGATDLRKPVPVNTLLLDHNYYDLTDEPAEIHYSDGTKLTLTATNDFAHYVVYVPEGQDYFCIENQTCSIDALNLHARGRTESSLLILQGGQTHTGRVAYEFNQ